MNNFDYITNPTTGRKVKTHGSLGKQIVKNYSKSYQPKNSIKDTVSIKSYSNKRGNSTDLAIENNPLLSEFKTIIESAFKIAIDVILNHTQQVLTQEQYVNLAMIHNNILNIDNHYILEQFQSLNVNQKDLSRNHLIILVLKCLGMQQNDILSIMPSEQEGGWYGCVEPHLTSEQIQQKSAAQKRRMCQRNTGYPVDRFPNNQSCVQAVMHEPTLCNPPPTIGERVRHSAAYAAGRVGSAAYTARRRVESRAATSFVGLMSFLAAIPDIGMQSSIILSVIIVLICVLSGFTRSMDSGFNQFMRDYRMYAERARQADERDRRRREREEREHREYQRQMDEINRQARERREKTQRDIMREWNRTQQQRLEALARRERRRIATTRMREAIKKVLSASKFVRETQITVSDKLRLETDSAHLSLIGYRVHVIGRGYGSIVDYDSSTKKDIISYDIRRGKALTKPLVKPIVLGTTRRYRKHLINRVGKAFRLISNINNLLVPWPLPISAIAEDSGDEDVPMARALSETSAERQLIAPSGIMVNTPSSDEGNFLPSGIARSSRPTPMTRILSDE